MVKMAIFTKLAGVLILMFTASCGTMPVSSIYKLRNFDIKTTNLAKFHAAVRIPQSLAIRQQGVKIDLGFKSEKAKIKFTEHIVMQQIDSLPSQALDDAQKSGHKIFIFKLNDSDAQKMRAVRSRINRLAKKHEDGVGSLSIDVETCKRGALPDGPLYLSTYLKSAELEDFVVMVNNVDLKKIDEVEENLNKIPPC